MNLLRIISANSGNSVKRPSVMSGGIRPYVPYSRDITVADLRHLSKRATSPKKSPATISLIYFLLVDLSKAKFSVIAFLKFLMNCRLSTSNAPLRMT